MLFLWGSDFEKWNFFLVPLTISTIGIKQDWIYFSLAHLERWLLKSLLQNYVIENIMILMQKQIHRPWKKIVCYGLNVKYSSQAHMFKYIKVVCCFLRVLFHYSNGKIANIEKWYLIVKSLLWWTWSYSASAFRNALWEECGRV